MPQSTILTQMGFFADAQYCPISPFPKLALVLMCLLYRSFENTAGKGEIARIEQFLLLPHCFPPISRTVCNLNEI